MPHAYPEARKARQLPMECGETVVADREVLQLLESRQLLRQVAEASAVQLQPSQAGHGLDVLREITALVQMGRKAGRCHYLREG